MRCKANCPCNLRDGSPKLDARTNFSNRFRGPKETEAEAILKEAGYKADRDLLWLVVSHIVLMSLLLASNSDDEGPIGDEKLTIVCKKLHNPAGLLFCDRVPDIHVPFQKAHEEMPAQELHNQREVRPQRGS